MFAQLSKRHTGGSVFTMLDTSAKFKKWEWVQSVEGKLAINPSCSQVPNNVGWSATLCNYQENQ